MGHFRGTCGSSVLLLCMVVVLAVARPTFGQANPILYYSFDDAGNPWRDDSGNGHTLSVSGSYSLVPGALGNAVHFNSNSLIGPRTSTSGLNYPGTGGFSVEYMVQVRSTAGAMGVRDYWAGVDCGEVFGLRYYDSTDKADFFVRHDFSPPTIIEAPVSRSDGDWVHLLGTYDPDGYTMSLYVDGVLASQGNMPAPMRTSIPPYVYVSGSYHGTEQSTVDEVKLYKTAIDPSAQLLFRWHYGDLPIIGHCAFVPRASGKVWESHPGYDDGGGASLDQYWDPDAKDFVQVDRSATGVMYEHSRGSFRWDSSSASNRKVSTFYYVPVTVPELPERMEAFMLSHYGAPFHDVVPGADLSPDAQKGRVDGSFTCVGLVEAAAESDTTFHGGQGFIPDVLESVTIGGKERPLLCPLLLYRCASEPDVVWDSDFLSGILDPIDFILTDPLGRRLGHASGVSYDEIPDAVYSGDGDIEFFVVLNRLEGLYHIQFFGTGNDYEAVLNMGTSEGVEADWHWAGHLDMGDASGAFSIPEPATLSLLALGALGLFAHCKRR